MTRLAVIVYSANNEAYTKLAVEHLERTVDKDLTKIIVVDNGSDTPFTMMGDEVIRYQTNIGGNAIFHRPFKDKWFGSHFDIPEFLAFLHCDMMVWEKDWDQRVVDAFDADPLLSLVGFVGSNEIDEMGGRGGGTMLNYRGAFFEGIGQASPAEAHGKRVTDLQPAAVLDHCSMIFRSSVLWQLTPQEGFFAPEHFYDKILSCEVLERGEHVAVLGIECDHFSGGIAPGNLLAEALRKRWLAAEKIEYNKARSDVAVYVESERRFKARFMSTGFIPLRVQPDYSIVR